MAKKLDDAGRVILNAYRVLERLHRALPARKPMLVTEEEYEALEYVQCELYLLLFDKSEDSDPDDLITPILDLLQDTPPA